jgi:uncharacterized protein YxeA
MKRIVVLLLFGLMCLPKLAISQTKNIDCSKNPSVQEGFTLFSNMPADTYQLTPGKIKTYSFEKFSLSGEKMLTKLSADKTLNACVLDYLMDNQELIPPEWKTKNVIFMGTILADAGGNKFFPTLYWWDNHWDVSRTYLKDAEYDDRIAAIK